ncbi:MAG: hypothetical protein J7M10_07840, partial [Candidatus Cloacimonetes bacterium]|nr:hypothetical protein [Candidatus Cloacimonadota bacterium]
MKKLYCIKIFLVILLMTSVKVFAHKQELHQHITREAFNLLQMSFPEGLDEMEYFVGTDENSSGYPVLSWGDCRIVAGAWTEDEYDMVYHYGTWRRPNYNDVPPWVEDLLFGFQDPEDNRAAHTTITHFWDADNGEDAQTHLTDTIHGALGQSTWEFTISENAMKKIRKYISGDYDQRWIYTEPGLMWEGCTYIALANDFSIPSLIELFNCEGTVTAISYRSAIDGEWYWVSEPSWPASWLGKGFTCELFGRMCHLLQDMSVPAHVHCTSHAGTMGMYSDYFEENEMDYHNNYHTWTAQEIYDNGEMFIDPYVHEDPIYYLMYFMNQITDHYADGKVNGDDNYDSTIPGLSDIIPTLGAPTLTNEINDINCKAMYDVLIPYAIRVTAGLMYWFACETGQLNPEIYTLNSYFYKYTNPVSDEENKEISLYYITHNPFDPEVRVTIEKESGEIIWDNVEVALHSGVPREGYLPSWNFAKRLLLEDDYTGPITIQVSEDGVLTEETTVNYNPSNKPPLPILFPWPDGEKGIYPTRYGNYTSGLYYNRSYKLNINAPYSGDIDTWYNIKIEWDEEDGEHIFPLNYTSYVQFNDNGTVDLDIPPKSVIIGSGVTAGNVRLKINDVEGWDNYPVVFNTEAFSGLIRTVSYPGIIIYCIGAAPSPGCPTLYCGNERENNIIPLGENQEQDCFDYSLLKNTVKNSEVIEMKVTEDQDNSNYFDLVQLVAVGHSKDTEVGVNNSNGEIFLYNPKSQIRFDTGKDSSFVLQAEDSLLINLSDFNIPPVE